MRLHGVLNYAGHAVFAKNDIRDSAAISLDVGYSRVGPQATWRFISHNRMPCPSGVMNYARHAVFVNGNFRDSTVAWLDVSSSRAKPQAACWLISYIRIVSLSRVSVI